MPDEKNEALAPTQANGVAQVTGIPGVLGALIPTGKAAASTLDLSTEAGQLLLQKCEESVDDSLRELVNTTVAIVHIYTKEVDKVNDQDGSVTTYRRICLVDDAGKVYGCASDGVRESLARFVAARGKLPFNPPFLATVRLKVIGQGKQRMWLEQLPTAKKGGAK